MNLAAIHFTLFMFAVALLCIGVRFGREIKVEITDGRPCSADEAIVFALSIDDYFAREQFLLSWANGDWSLIEQEWGKDWWRLPAVDVVETRGVA